MVKIELSFDISNAQYDCNFIVIKPKLFGNIPLILDTNDLECYKKTIHKRELSFVKRNLSIVEKAESSSVECNPTVVQGVELS